MKYVSSNFKYCLFTCMIFCGIKVNAQQLNMDVRDFNGNMQVYDPANPSKSKTATFDYAEVEGTAFWSDQWNPAIIYFNNGGKAKINEAKLNLYTDEIHYLSSNGSELAVDNGGISRLVFLSKSNLSQPIASFAKLPNHVSGQGYTYYKVLNAGVYQLILLQKQLIKTSPYDPIQGKSIRSFYSKKNYAIYNEGKVIPLRDLDRASVMGATPNNDLIKQSEKRDNTKLKTEKDVIEYLEKVNSSIIKVTEKY